MYPYPALCPRLSLRTMVLVLVQPMDFASHSGLLQPMDLRRDVWEPRHGVSIWGALDAHGPAATEPARRPRSFANVSVLELRNPGLRHSHSGFRFQIFRFQIPDSRFQISDFRSRISDFRFILSDFRYQISDFEFQFSDPKPSRCTDPADFLISDFFFQISSFFFQISRARPAAGGKPAGHIARRRRKNREVMGSTPIGEAFAFWGGWGCRGGGRGAAKSLFSFAGQEPREGEAFWQPRASPSRSLISLDVCSACFLTGQCHRSACSCSLHTT